jgi:hypothetical protein
MRYPEPLSALRDQSVVAALAKGPISLCWTAYALYMTYT